MTLEYRILQVLGVLMNEIQQKVMVTSVMSAGIWIHCLSLNVLIKMPDGENNILFAGVFLFLTLEGAGCISVVVGGWAQVNIQSENLFQRLNCNLSESAMHGERNVHELRKFFRSCAYVKVKFGTLNYIDRLTPLNSIAFSLDLTVNLLLLRKKN